MNLGNPELKSFKTAFIRRVIVDNIYAWVNKEIIPQTEELLCRAVERGVAYEGKFPHTLKSYDPDGTEDQKFGLFVKFDTEANLSGIEEGLGFTAVNGGFVYDPTVYVNMADLPSLIDDVPKKIGARQLKLDATGEDVKFIHYFLGLANKQNLLTFNKETEEAIIYWQTRMGITVTGIVDWNTWGSIIPKKHVRLVGGSAGPKIRALQSALRCIGYNVPLTSRFGTETLRSLREFQDQNGLRTNGRAGQPEWEILFDYR